jgi:hypothetical protein
MVAVTYGVARVPKVAAQTAAKATQQKSFFARFIDALVESRIQQAHREIVRHAHLLPPRALSKDGAKGAQLGGW